MDDQPCKNTDVEIWREAPGDYYSPSIFVTEQGGIGINVGGLCIVKPVRDWHLLAAESIMIERSHSKYLATCIAHLLDVTDTAAVEALLRALREAALSDRHVLLAANHVPNDGGVEMIDRCAERLRSGGSLILFPEGTRTRRDRKLRFKAGAAAVAARTDSALLPVLIECEPLTLGKGEPWYAIPPRKPSFRIDILEPRTLDSLIGAGGSERLRKRELNKALKTFFVERLDGWT